MSDESNITQWVPVLGTLGGALLGFFASFATAFFIKSQESKEQKDSRDRHRIERIYELFILIEKENKEDLGKVIRWINYTHAIRIEDIEGIPPLIELEMLVSLYFEGLELSRIELMKDVHHFSKRYFEAQQQDFRSVDKPYRQKATEEFFVMSSNVSKRISELKSEVSRMVKS